MMLLFVLALLVSSVFGETFSDTTDVCIQNSIRNSISSTDSTMEAIQKNTELTADHTQKDYYDYLAVAISVLAFIVAGITLYYTIRTYRSQKKTEANTTPSINRDIQRYLLLEQLTNIYDIYVYLFALFFYLRKHQHKAIPSKHFWNSIEVKLEQFHESLFYNNIEEWKKFSFLKDAHRTIDNDLKILRASIENREATGEENEREFGHLIDEAGYILWAYKPVIEDIYHLNYNKVLKDYFFESKNSKIEKLFKAKYIHDDSKLIRYDLRDFQFESLIGNDVLLLLESTPAYELLSGKEIISFKQQFNNDVCTVLYCAGYEIQPTDGNEKHNYNLSIKEEESSNGFFKDNDNPYIEQIKLAKAKAKNRWYFYFKHFD